MISSKIYSYFAKLFADKANVSASTPPPMKNLIVRLIRYIVIIDDSSQGFMSQCNNKSNRKVKCPTGSPSLSVHLPFIIAEDHMKVFQQCRKYDSFPSLRCWSCLSVRQGMPSRWANRRPCRRGRYLDPKKV